jgi:hypothetical protein
MYLIIFILVSLNINDLATVPHELPYNLNFMLLFTHLQVSIIFMPLSRVYGIYDQANLNVRRYFNLKIFGLLLYQSIHY